MTAEKVIKFTKITGDVEILEKDKPSSKPILGKGIHFAGRNLIIKTGPHAKATLTIKGEKVELTHDSVIRLYPHGKAVRKKNSAKLFVGRLWAKIDSQFGTDRDEEVGNAAVGVRG